MMQHYPGSAGEHHLQEQYRTVGRARAFYNNQVLDRLNDAMREFIGEQSLMFIATADAQGEPDCSIRAGVPGSFAVALDERRLAYPEYRGNGVMASLGNISENPQVGLLFVDFFKSTVGLHVNGFAEIVENIDILDRFAGHSPLIAAIAVEGGRRQPERWVLVHVVEAYMHCSKHIPRLQQLDETIHWGTDDVVRKGGDYFRAKHESRPWVPAHDHETVAVAGR